MPPSISLLPSSLEALQPAIECHRLANGLRVYTLEDHSAPLVSIQNWLQVGSFHEKNTENGEPGTTGVSHFFEHMMFKGTSQHPHYFEEVYALGGKLNAWTWLDSTVYWEVVPSQHLHRVIQVEADRFRNMKIDFHAMETERDVIKSERLLRIDNTPHGIMGELLSATALGDHPYHWPTIGWMSDIDHLSLDMAEAHRGSYYVPDNLFIVIVGSFDTAATLAAIEDKYGDIPARSTKKAETPPQQAAPVLRRDYAFRDIERPAVNIAYPAPAFRDPEWPILEVMNQILNGGRGSRMKQALIFADTPLTTAVSSNLYPVREPYLYSWSAAPLEDVSIEEIWEAMTHVFHTLCNELVEADELERAITRLQAGAVRRMLTNQDKAELIGFGIRTSDNPDHFFSLVHQYAKVTREEIRECARKLFQKGMETRIVAVAPRRIQETLEKAEFDPPMSAFLQELYSWQQTRWTLLQEQNDLTSGQRYNLALKERGEVALENAEDAESIEKIHAYLNHSEHGLEARIKNWNADKESLKKREGFNETKRQELLSQLDTFQEGGSHAESIYDHLRWILNQDGTDPCPTLSTNLHTEIAGFTRLLLCLEMDSRDLSEEAKDTRHSLLATLPVHGEANPFESSLRSIIFDTQRVAHLKRNPLLGGGA